jgi:glutaredoxin-like protein
MEAKLLNDNIVQQIQEAFSQLQEPVQVLFFGRKDGCDYCADTLQLIEEVAGLSDKIALSAYDLDEDADVAAKYGIDKAPGMVIAGLENGQIQDYGIRIAGIPSGHEFSSLIHDLILVSRRSSGLSEPTRDFLKNLSEPIHLQVFVTPTCPYCPRAVVLAHQMALESPMVVAEMVEAMEFPELADRFSVSGVPQTTINQGAGTVVGAVPEQNLLAEIMRVVKESARVKV